MFDEKEIGTDTGGNDIGAIQRISETPAMTDDESDHVSLLQQRCTIERNVAMFHMAKSLAHLLGTALNVIAGRASLIEANLGPANEAILKHVDIIKNQVNEIATKIRDTLSLLQPKPAAPVRNAIHVPLLNAVRAHTVASAKRRIKLSVEKTTNEEAVFHALITSFVLINLLEFAIQDVAPGKTISMQATQKYAQPPISARGRSVEGETILYSIVLGDHVLARDLMSAPLELWKTDANLGTEHRLLLTVTLAMVREYGGWIEIQQKDSDTQIDLHWPCTKI